MCGRWTVSRTQAPNLQPDCGTDVFSRKRRRIDHVHCMGIVLVDTGGNTRNRCEELAQLAEQRPPDYSAALAFIPGCNGSALSSIGWPGKDRSPHSGRSQEDANPGSGQCLPKICQSARRPWKDWYRFENHLVLGDRSAKRCLRIQQAQNLSTMAGFIPSRVAVSLKVPPVCGRSGCDPIHEAPVERFAGLRCRPNPVAVLVSASTLARSDSATMPNLRNDLGVIRPWPSDLSA